MDAVSYKTLRRLNLPNLHLIALEDFERGDTELLQAKQNRTLVEYYFTCTPSLPLFVLNRFPEIDLITYLDADLFFFADPAPVYKEIANHSIAIIGHRFPTQLRHLETRGIFNVGWLSFRRDEHALSCLQWWREQCLKWCYDRVEEGRFADQKYLDDWPVRFQNVIVLQHKGANLAPWNFTNYNIHLVNGSQVWVDEQPLIFFHFHGFKRILSWLYNPNLAMYKASPSKVTRQNIYAPYIRTLLEVTLPEASRPIGSIRDTKSFWFRLFRRLRRLPQNVLEVLGGKYLVVMKGRVI